ncbi:hypothetical protein F4780DRAFT_780546 [Xylariomycetidae sp. FL0641]|nr:hypothetical protein F4780DRAFT_780546 [Xylariomycetidae sp. FL0641]
MAQGTLKKPSKPSKTSTGRANKPQPPKKGARVAKAKHSAKADQVQRKYAAGLAGKTEKLLGERAGHLELIGLGKKAARGGGKDTKEEEGAKKKTGGTRKFG